MTALHIAAERGHIQIVEYLAEKRADIDIQDKKGVMICDYSNVSVSVCSEFELAIYNCILVRSGEDLNPPGGTGNLCTFTVLVCYIE